MSSSGLEEGKEKEDGEKGFKDKGDDITGFWTINGL